MNPTFMTKESEQTIMPNIIQSILTNRIPGQLVVQLTDRCNARCPQCGMRASASFIRSSLDRDTVFRLIDVASDRGIKAISFTGGEPLLDVDHLIELINRAGEAGIPYIRTGTNGFIFHHPERTDFYDRVARLADRLAATPLRNFWISLDSADDAMHEKMRGFPGIVVGIAKALPIFHRAGIYPSVNLGINRNVGGLATSSLKPGKGMDEQAYLQTFRSRYQDAFRRFYQRAVDLGFTMANACYPMSIDPPEDRQGLSAVYAATTVADIVRFTPSEKTELFRALACAIQAFRGKIRIFSPLCAIEALIRQYSGTQTPPTYGCHGGIDFFFVNAADGHAYPCGYRGNEDLGWLWEIPSGRPKPLKEKDACRQCDWECFRDPSELFGPLLASVSNPVGLLRRLATSPGTLRTWTSDIRYYRACNFFDGRKAPDYRKLRPFTHKCTPDRLPAGRRCTAGAL
jgi:MoaA/NifB/PqqE/SkfB family radical SAM enzyme